MAKGWLETRCEEIAALALPFCVGTTFAYGDVKLATHGAPPRVVWVRPTDGADEIEPPDSTSSEKVVCIWRHRVEAHLWAARGGDSDTDEAAVEALARVILWALFSQSPAEMTLAGSWLVEGWTKAGRAIVIAFTLGERVLEPVNVKDSTRPLTTGFQPDGTTTDGILSAGEG